MKKICTIIALSLVCHLLSAGDRKILDFDGGWEFSFGDASSPVEDFACGTEYFNFWTKAGSIHNEGPYSPDFDKSKWNRKWVDVCLPHDFVVDLPFSPQASHSHGYKTVGFKFPQTSVGWYRKVFEVPQEYSKKHVSIRFDGIFHSSQVWVNGFYLGREDDGYVSCEYDVTPYLNYGGKNVVAVRADASQESGWYYEGGGIYRHCNMIVKGKVNVADDGIFIYSDIALDGSAQVNVEMEICNCLPEQCGEVLLSVELKDADGNVVARRHRTVEEPLLPFETKKEVLRASIEKPHLWDITDPYLYTVTATVSRGGEILDRFDTKTGIRAIRFTHDDGFLLNGRRVPLKGVNLHQDHSGVGTAITDDIYEYRLMRLRSIGCNAIRSSHNPMAPSLLRLCDSLGFLVIDENRLMGVNGYHKEHLERMIRRDRNHPCIILWSIGNEEWGIEWNDFGRRLTAGMREFCHCADPTRLMTVATSSGPAVVENADVAGYNYILQNKVVQLHQDYPSRCSVGTEETTGCGTRGWYFDDTQGGRMKAINRAKQGPDSLYNCIERGWKFCLSHPWYAGVFYWTGFDYRGEPNPLSYPATGSSFGILDYCGFCKDEAYYLKSWWTDETVLHILPHWNLAGHEGETTSVWVYSNCDEVELIANGKRLGRKKMPSGGHLEWNAVYKKGYVKAIGYRNGQVAARETVRTASQAAAISTQLFVRPGTAVIDISLHDKDGNFVPDACNGITATIDGPAYILGVGNGDSAWKDPERPSSAASKVPCKENSTFSWHAFNGRAQLIIGSPSLSIGKQKVTVRLSADGFEKVLTI